MASNLNTILKAVERKHNIESIKSAFQLNFDSIISLKYIQILNGFMGSNLAAWFFVLQVLTKTFLNWASILFTISDTIKERHVKRLKKLIEDYHSV